MGTAMAGLPVHPRLAHMMLRGARLGLGEVACALAALLSDRDFMRGRGADLRLRVEAILARKAPKMITEAARQLSRRLGDAAKKEASKAGSHNPADPVDHADQVGLLLAFAYPDRIGERRKGTDARYRLSGGRGGILANDDGLASEPYIAVAGLTDRHERQGFTLPHRYRARALKPISPIRFPKGQRSSGMRKAMRCRRAGNGGSGRWCLTKRPPVTKPDLMPLRPR